MAQFILARAALEIRQLGGADYKLAWGRSIETQSRLREFPKFLLGKFSYFVATRRLCRHRFSWPPQKNVCSPDSLCARQVSRLEESVDRFFSQKIDQFL